MQKDIQNRISRVRGQLDGLERMIESKADCAEILNQVAAIKSAISRVGVILLSEETSCFTLKKSEKDKLNKMLDRFVKTN